MPRYIDADALEKEGWSLHRTIRVDKNTEEYQKKPLKQVPTIEPERKKGKWIDCDGSEHWKCDKCGCRAGYWFNEENSSSWELDMSEWLSNFCPNCGADMRGEQDGNT